MAYACEEAQRIRRELKDSQTRFAQFGYKENQPHSGASKTRAIKLAKEHDSRAVELGNELLTHVGSCPICRAKGWHSPRMRLAWPR